MSWLGASGFSRDAMQSLGAAYASMGQPQQTTEEAFEQWLDEQLDEGADLSEFTTDEVYDYYVNEVLEGGNSEVLGENRRAARAAGGYKDDSKKQPDPSKDGFTGIGNMSIDAIRRMSARIEKEKEDKKEAFEPAVGEGEGAKYQLDEISRERATRAYSERSARTRDYEDTYQDRDPKGRTKSGRDKSRETLRRLEDKFGKKAGEDAEKEADKYYGEESDLLASLADAYNMMYEKKKDSDKCGEGTYWDKEDKKCKKKSSKTTVVVGRGGGYYGGLHGHGGGGGSNGGGDTDPDGSDGGAGGGGDGGGGE